MHKKNILIVTSTFPKHEKDIISARFVYDLARSLTPYYNVHVLTPHSPDAKNHERLDGMSIHRFCYFLPKKLQKLATGEGILANIKTNKLLILQLPFLFLAEVLSIIYVLKKEKIDILNTHWIVPQGLAAALVRKFINVKHVLTIHSAGIFTLKRWGKAGKAVARFIIKRTDIVMPVSSYIKNTLDQLVNTGYCFKISPMGVDLSRFNTSGNNKYVLRSDILNLLFVGKLVEKKGLKYLLNALSLLKQEGLKFKLKVVGSGPLEESHKQYSVSLNVNKNIDFLSWVPNDKLPEVYNAADIVIVPSVFDKKGETEGMPVVILESLAMSRPVIASRISGIPDIIKDGYNGWLINPADAQALKSKLIEVSNIGLDNFKKNAYNTAKKFGINNIASVYRDAIGDS